jgi:hypothetical protein
MRKFELCYGIPVFLPGKQQFSLPPATLPGAKLLKKFDQNF